MAPIMPTRKRECKYTYLAIDVDLWTIIDKGYTISNDKAFLRFNWKRNQKKPHQMNSRAMSSL